MQKYKGIFTLLGFSFLILGFLSLVLNMVGLELSVLLFLDALGALPSFLIKLFMVLSGIVIIALARTNWERLENEPEEIDR